MKKFLICAVTSAILMACATAKVRYVKDGFSAPDFVAVLPADNQTNDLAAPRAVIGAVASALIGANYFPITTPAQEEILRKMGLTDGGQLNAFKLPDLASKLGTDGLAVTTINDFKKVNIGFYVSPTVDTTVALHDSTGEKLWEVNSKYTQKTLNLSIQAALQAGAQELAGDMVGKIFKTHLIKESQIMGGLMVNKLNMNKPSLAYPGPGYQPPTGLKIAKE